MEVCTANDNKEKEKILINNNKSDITYNNSIEFINEIEKKYINNKNLQEKEIYQLNNHKNNKSKEFIKVINHIPKASLNSLIFKKGIIITCMAIKKNNIYIGTNKGEIRAYSWKTEKKLNYLINSEIEKERKQDVICMDVSEDNKVLVVGHLNGYIILWDIQSAECKKVIKDEFNTQIIAIRFTLIENSFYEFLASDLKGAVKRLGVNEGFFYNSVNSNSVIEYSQTICVIEVLQLNKEQKKIIYKYNNSDNIEEPLIVAFGSIDFVFIVQLEPEIKRLYNFKKPSYLKGSFIPDICFGLGNIPAPIFYSKDYDEEQIKNIKKEDLNINIQSEIDITQKYQFVFVSWGKIIYIFIISFELKDFLSINLIGYYINNEPIIRMGFLSNNIIYILNLYKKFKILNTNFMNSGEIKIDSEGNIINNNIVEAELCPEFGLDYDILFQTYVPDTYSNLKNAYKSTFNNVVISQNKNIFVVCKKYIYIGCLLNWEQCINELFKNSEWLNAFKLGIDIYHGDNKILDGIHLNVKERKENIKRVLKGLILQLILNTLNIKGIFYNEEKSEEILSKCINASIELCIDVKELDYLLKEILPILEEKGYFDFFIEKIKPFIIEKKINNEQLGQNITSKILNYYLKKNDYITLSQIIINLNLNIFDINEIKDICFNNNIIFPLIYIFFKSNKDDLFLLIKKIFDLFKKSNNIPKEQYNNYKNDIINNKISNNKINEIYLNRQYLGQKLLWLIDLCLKGQKYPSEEKMEENIYMKLIQKLFLWLINDEILNELVIFDSYTFFIILSKFFKNDKLFELITKIKYEDNKELFEGINYNGNNLKEIDIKIIIIDIILNKINLIKNILIDDDFNEFVLQINSNKQILSAQYIIDSINYFINFKNKDGERAKCEDFFEFHSKIVDENEKIEKYSILINKVLENYKKKIDKKELNKLLINANKKKFPLVCIKILQILNDNIKCLDIYLEKKNIKNRYVKICEFINDFMNKAQKEERKNYKKEILKRIGKLGEISISKLLDLNLKWFNEELFEILEKLSFNNEIKLKYIEQYIHFYNENNINEEKDNIFIKEKDYFKLLNLHIETLCKMGMKKNIINIFKNNKFYLNDDCLKICLKNNVFDAAIYIYMHQLNFTEALNLCKKEITNNINNLIQECINESDTKKKELFFQHDEIINKCCFICEKESEEIPLKDRKRIWFEVLNFLYKQLELIIAKEKKVNKNLKEISTKISDDINILILKMYPHTDMKSILEEIYKKTQMTEFKGINNILSQFVKEQIIFKNIFNKVKSLLDYSISVNYKEKNKYNIKGNNYIMKECNYCHKNFEDKDNILLLKCGHIIHKNNICCINIKNKYNICRICYNKELRQSIGSVYEMDKKSKNKIDNYIQNDINNLKKDINDKNMNKNLNKLNLIQEKYNERYSLLDVDIENIKSNKMKNKKK